MAIETQPESAQAPGGGDPGATQKERAWWLRPNIFTAIVGAVVGYYFWPLAWQLDGPQF